MITKITTAKFLIANLKPQTIFGTISQFYDVNCGFYYYEDLDSAYFSEITVT